MHKRSLNIPSYLHVGEGRLRVKIPEMKRSVSKALHVEKVIRSLQGTVRVTANPTTGNVLVFFDSKRVTPTEILLTLKRANYLRERPPDPSFGLTAEYVNTVSRAVARSVIEALMERAIFALL